MRARLLVMVRNTGFTTLQPGGQVVVSVEPSHVTLQLRVTHALAPGASATLAGNVIAAKSALVVTARSGKLSARAVLALPPPPTTLGSAPRPWNGGLLLDWAPAADTDVTTYRVYRGVGPHGPLSLAGIATSTQWLDMTRALRTAYRYQITAVDAYGRESSLSTALITAAS
jgi:fibronectin type 3 domain-containing protein